MHRKTFDGMNCSIARALDEVGEWWSLLVVRECTLGTTRFDDFQRRLGIARNVLTARLNRLVEHGVLVKVLAEGSERRSEYRLTEKGEALYPALRMAAVGVIGVNEPSEPIENTFTALE